ncbi:MAG TPA: polyketide synthase dehydratase domain-containing protein [Thermoanaerobaculia bacterium]|nr:polyketide synthase dehydratase domain-containing protein [Thermoanaerobaculia bacterium]
MAARCTVSDQSEGWEAFTAGGGLVHWGPRWQSLRRARLGTGEALLDLELPDGFAADLDGLGLHPALVDVATGFGGGMLSGGHMLPASYGRVRSFTPLPGTLLAHLHTPRRSGGGETLTLDVTLMTPEGEVCAEIEGFTMRRVAEGGRRTAPQAAAGAGSADWIQPAEGVEAFRRILSRGRFAQVAVSPLDLNRTIEAMRRQAGQRAAPEAPQQQAKFQRPDLGTAYVPPSTATETALAEIWQGVLGLAQVGVDDNFFDLGGDSVIGIQIVARATARGLQFSPEQLFEHQTVAELARWLEGSAAPEEPVEGTGDGFSAGDFADADLADDLDKILSKVRTLAG